MNNIHQYFQTLDYAVVIVYLIVLLAIGYWVSFVKKKKEGANLFLAGQSLKWPAIGLTMWGTNVGPAMLIASAASGFATGVAGANFSWYAFIFLMVLAMVFAPFYRVTKVNTLPEFIGKRYNSVSRELLAWYSLVTILISWLGGILYTGGILVSQIMDWPLWLSLTLLIAIAAFFTIAGGLEAIALTNVFQMIFLIIVSASLVITGIIKAGGLSEIYHATPGSYWKLFQPADDPGYSWLAIMLGYPVMGIWFWCTDQSMVQSVLGAKSLKHGQIGANFVGWLKIIDMPLFFLPGILAFVLFPHLSNPNEAYATLVTHLFPSGLIGLVIVVIIAGLISTIDSALNSLSTIFTLDIYVKRYKPHASQKQIIRIGRFVALFGSVTAVVIALGISKIDSSDLYMLLQSILGFLAPPMTVVFLMGVLWKRVTPVAANTILSVGSVISIGIGICSLFGIPDREFWPHPLLLSFYIFIGLTILISVITLATDNRYTGSQLPGLTQIRKNKEGQKMVWALWIILTLVMISLYLIFNVIL